MVRMRSPWILTMAVDDIWLFSKQAYSPSSILVNVVKYNWKQAHNELSMWILTLKIVRHRFCWILYICGKWTLSVDLFSSIISHSCPFTFCLFWKKPPFGVFEFFRSQSTDGEFSLRFIVNVVYIKMSWGLFNGKRESRF